MSLKRSVPGCRGVLQVSLSPHSCHELQLLMHVNMLPERRQRHKHQWMSGVPVDYSVVLGIVYYKCHVYFVVKNKGEYFFTFSMINNDLGVLFGMFHKATDRNPSCLSQARMWFLHKEVINVKYLWMILNSYYEKKAHNESASHLRLE